MQPGEPDDGIGGASSSDEGEGRHHLQSMEGVTSSTQSHSSITHGDTLPKRKVENAVRKFSDYRLHKIIGTGSFGKVCLASLE